VAPIKPEYGRHGCFETALLLDLNTWQPPASLRRSGPYAGGR